MAIAGVAEVPHWQPGGSCRLRLFRTAPGQFVIYHDVTGERYQLAEGRAWQMFFKDGWAFVHAQG
eukprot:8369915-Lingulodinium_polyedra.AAC.1